MSAENNAVESQEKNGVNSELGKEQDVKENKDTAAASYFLILSPILLITRKDSKFIQHHASQAFVLFALFIFLWMLGSFITFFAWLTVGVFFVSLIGFVQAIQGEWYEMPYVYNMVKDGITVDGITSGVKKTLIAGKKILKGLFPKNTKENTENDASDTNSKNVSSGESSSSSEKEKQLEQRIETLEKLLNARHNETISSDEKKKNKYLSLDDISEKQQKIITQKLSDLSQKDENAEVEKTESFYVVTGSFGEVKIGVVNGEVQEEKI